jgi:nucleotide-binding universal stress UspA family protein
MVHHILVAIDGSEGSRRAALYARDLAKQTNAHITLLVAIQPATAVTIPPFDAVSITPAQPDPEHITAARALIDGMEQELGLATVGSQAAFGPAADTICAEARRLGADLIVVGARGLSSAAAAVLGSVSSKVVHKADRPVLVVR